MASSLEIIMRFRQPVSDLSGGVGVRMTLDQARLLRDRVAGMIEESEAWEREELKDGVDRHAVNMDTLDCLGVKERW